MIIETCPKCGHDLMSLVLTSIPPIHKKECHNCGWSWEEREDIVRVPFSGMNNDIIIKTTTLNYPVQPSNKNYNISHCANCNNNPINGGNGICNCTLGQPQINC